ncbi:MAG: AtpZ/AtpI family protein [Beijerinckiaceae bacterium]
MANTDDGKGNDEALRARLETLSTSIEAHRKKPLDEAAQRSGRSDRGLGNAMSLGFRVVTELVAGVVVGGGIGWVLDRWLSTKPFLLILFLILGTVGGFWNTIRATNAPFRGPDAGS